MISRFTYGGLACTPIESTRRRVAGGIAIDIVVHEEPLRFGGPIVPRRVPLYCTVNAANIVEVQS